MPQFGQRQYSARICGLITFTSPQDFLPELKNGLNEGDELGGKSWQAASGLFDQSPETELSHGRGDPVGHEATLEVGKRRRPTVVGDDMRDLTDGVAGAGCRTPTL